MKAIKTQDAVGKVLYHDVTQIVRGVTKGVLFQKGHIIKEEDVPVLLKIGKEHVYIPENKPEMLHENDAAEILAALCRGENMHTFGPKEGKIELIADIDGLLMVDTGRLRAVNSLGEMMIATRVSGFPVKKGDTLCGVRIIPLVIEKEKMEGAQQAAGSEPILRLLPIKQKKYGLVITGSEVFHNRIPDTFTSVVQEKLAEYGSEMAAHAILDDDGEKITIAIRDMLGKGVEMVFCTGGMSVDPDDKTALAIRNAAAHVVSYGAPVLPGAMFMLAYTADLRPICGLPGCVMYSKRTVFDLVLPRLLADVPVTAEWLAGLGNGGLCLACKDSKGDPECHFPNCVFGAK
jgi:hypothetical protein